MATTVTRPPLFSRIEKANTLGTFVGGFEQNVNQRLPLGPFFKCTFQYNAFQQDAFQMCLPMPEGRFDELTHIVPRARLRGQLEHWQNLPGWRTVLAVFGDGDGSAIGDAIASSEGTSLADASASATGDATASGDGTSTVFPFAHQQLFEVVRRARRITTIEQWQNPTLAIQYNADTTGTATGDAIVSGEGNSLSDASASAIGDATASAEGASTEFPFAHKSAFDIVSRARRIATLEQWQTLPTLRISTSATGDGTATGDANASAEGNSLADATASASGDATASAEGASNVFPFSHQYVVETVRRARRIVTLEQWQNPTLLGLRRNSDADGTATGDATASAEGASNIFPFAHQSLFDIVRRARRIVTLEQWQTLATKTTVVFSQADGTATGDATASAEGASLVDATGSAIGNAICGPDYGSVQCDTFDPLAFETACNIIYNADALADSAGAAQGDSDASAIGFRARRVKLVQGIEGPRKGEAILTIRTAEGTLRTIRGSASMLARIGMAGYPIQPGQIVQEEDT